MSGLEQPNRVTDLRSLTPASSSDVFDSEIYDWEGLAASESGNKRAPAAAPAAPQVAPEPERLAVLTARAPDVDRERNAVRRGRERVKREVDTKLLSEAENFKDAVNRLFETPAGLKNLADFVTAHLQYSPGQSAQWNKDFCDTFWPGNTFSAQEQRTHACALQLALDAKFQQRSGDSQKGHVFHETGGDNPHTLMDGSLGAYTVSALANQLNAIYDQANSKPTDWSRFGQYADLTGAAESKRVRYNEACNYLNQFPAVNSSGRPEQSSGRPANLREGQEALSANYKENLQHYLNWLRKGYSNADQVVDPSKPDFIRVFKQVVAYVERNKSEDWPSALSELDLSFLDLEIIWPSRLKQKLPEKGKDYRFKGADLNQFQKAIRSLYKSRHWTNYDGLAKEGEADAAWFTFRNFLEKPEYSTQEVHGAYQAYLDARHDKNQEGMDAAFKALGIAIDHQQKQAEAAIRYWAQPGRLPEGRYLQKSDLESVRKKLSETLPSPFRTQIWHGDSAHEVLKPIFKVLTKENYGKDLAFRDFAELEASTYPNEFQTFQAQLIDQGLFGFLDNIPAQEPMRSNTIKRNNEKVLKLFNSAIWCRNIDLFLSEKDKDFLPPEK